MAGWPDRQGDVHRCRQAMVCPARPPRSWCARKLGFLVSSQLITTKLSVPAKPRRGLARPRLVERLERGAEARLTLVSAPAGFGKTTLLAGWLADSPAVDRSVAWLSLDPTDNEPVAFWTYVVTALHRALPGVDLTALELIASPSVAFRSVLSSLLNELAAVPGDVWLILDDYHLVEDPGIRDEMTYLLEHLPAQVHPVLLTRADPDLPLARWRMRGELVEIRAADLRFTSDEAGAYLSAVPGVALDATDVAVLAERTEGWIAALQLASLSLQGREDVSGFVSQFAGDDRYIVDYLVDEVLTHQPDTVREFLLQSAVLDRLTGPLCDAVTGCGGGTDTLAALERANLFTVALDDRREWYRYHRLFADVLRARLLSERPEQVPVLHRRASRWYESQGLTDEAIGHALTGQDFDRAVHLMELAMPASVATGTTRPCTAGSSAARRHRATQPGPQCLLRIHVDGVRRRRRRRVATRRRRACPGSRSGRRDPRGGRHRRAAHAAVDHRRLPSLTRVRARRCSVHHTSMRGVRSRWRVPTTTSPGAVQPDSSAWPRGPRETRRRPWHLSQTASPA